METAVRSADRQNNFDAMRLFFAVLVIFAHSFPLLRGPFDPVKQDPTVFDPLFRFTDKQMDCGFLAVSSFFILSGYLILASWTRSKSAIDYLKKRALRIYPCFIVVSLLCVFLVAPRVATHPETYFKDLKVGQSFLNILLLRDPVVPPVFPGNPVPLLNVSLWTVTYEFSCYIGVLALGLCFARWLRPVMTTLFLASFGVYIAQQYGWPIPNTAWVFLSNLIWWPAFGTSFLAGSLFYLYRNQIRYTMGGAAIALLALVIAADHHKLVLAYPLCGGYLLFATAFAPGLQLQGLSRRFGDLSYGTYCYAFTVQGCLVYTVGKHLNPYTFFLAALPITLFFAVLSWRFVEAPCLRLKDRRSGPAGTEAAASPASADSPRLAA